MSTLTSNCRRSRRAALCPTSIPHNSPEGFIYAPQRPPFSVESHVWTLLGRGGNRRTRRCYARGGEEAEILPKLRRGAVCLPALAAHTLRVAVPHTEAAHSHICYSVEDYTTEGDDAAFRTASGILKLFALGAHQVRTHVLYLILEPISTVSTSVLNTPYVRRRGMNLRRLVGLAAPLRSSTSVAR